MWQNTAYWQASWELTSVFQLSIKYVASWPSVPLGCRQWQTGDTPSGGRHVGLSPHYHSAQIEDCIDHRGDYLQPINCKVSCNLKERGCTYAGLLGDFHTSTSSTFKADNYWWSLNTFRTRMDMTAKTWFYPRIKAIRLPFESVIFWWLLTAWTASRDAEKVREY